MGIFFRKLLLVIFITALIWIWADEALTREMILPATIAVDKSADPSMWINLNNQPAYPIQLKLSGPSSKIDAVDRRLRDGSLRLDFFVNPSEEQLLPGSHSYNVLDLIKNSRTIADLGLQVESTEPASVNIDVVQLSKQMLMVQVLNENLIPIEGAIAEPATVEMYVPQNWNGAKLKATVVLIPQEKEQARTGGILRKPAIELAPGTPKISDTEVKITLPSTTQQLKEFSIVSKIGYSFTPNRAGKYNVELINQNHVLAPIKIEATEEAKDAYESMPFKIILDIKDDDPVGTEWSRAVSFNLPIDYVRKNEITVLEPEQRKAKFKLVPVEAP